MGILSWYVTRHSGKLSLLPSLEWEMSTGQEALARKACHCWLYITDCVVYPCTGSMAATTLSPKFYRPDALANAQWTVSKHRRQKYHTKQISRCLRTHLARTIKTSSENLSWSQARLANDASGSWMQAEIRSSESSAICRNEARSRRSAAAISALPTSRPETNMFCT